MTNTMTDCDLRSEPWSAIYPYVLLSTYRFLICQVYVCLCYRWGCYSFKNTTSRFKARASIGPSGEDSKDPDTFYAITTNYVIYGTQLIRLNPFRILRHKNQTEWNVVRAAILFVVSKRHKNIVLTSINGWTQEAEATKAEEEGRSG